MTPLEIAARVAYDLPVRTRSFHSDYGPDLSDHAKDVRAIITAFLEAAAEDEATCRRVGFECGWEPHGPVKEGRNAILALKEAVG